MPRFRLGLLIPLALPCALLAQDRAQDKGTWSFSREGNFAIIHGNADFKDQGHTLTVQVSSTITARSLASSSYSILVPTGVERSRGLALSFYKKQGEGLKELKTVHLDFTNCAVDSCEALVARDRPQKAMTVDQMDGLLLDSDILVVAFFYKGDLKTVRFGLSILRASLQ